MKARLTNILTFKYSAIQMSHNALNSVLGAYAAIFLRYKGFTSTEVGLALAIGGIISIIIQPLIASFADKADKLTIRQINFALMAFNFFVGFIMLFGNSFKPIVFMAFIIASSVQISLTSLINSLAVGYINKGVFINFGAARGMGSLSFAIFSLSLGFIIEVSSPDILMVVFLLLYFLLALNTFFFKVKPHYNQYMTSPINKDYLGENAKTSSSTLDFFKKYKRFTIYLSGLTLMYISYIIINTYLINIIEDFGGDSGNLGVGLALAAALELPVMASFSYLLKRYKCSSLIKFSAVFYIVKAAITLAASNMAMIYLAQAMQIFGFAIFTPANLYYVNMVVREKDSVKGQSMANIATFGLAGVIGNSLGGFLQDKFGISTMLTVGLIATTVGVMIIYLVVEDTPLGLYKRK